MTEQRFWCMLAFFYKYTGYTHQVWYSDPELDESLTLYLYARQLIERSPRGEFVHPTDIGWRYHVNPLMRMFTTTQLRALAHPRLQEAEA